MEHASFPARPQGAEEGTNSGSAPTIPPCSAPAEVAPIYVIFHRDNHQKKLKSALSSVGQSKSGIFFYMSLNLIAAQSPSYNPSH